MAAMTAPLDTSCSRYGSAVQSNEDQVQMIESSNLYEKPRLLELQWNADGSGGIDEDSIHSRDDSLFG